MKNLLILCVLAACVYFGIRYDESRTIAKPEPAIRIIEPAATSKKSWLQERIDTRESVLNKGAYDQHYGVARSATIYYVPPEQAAVTPVPLKSDSR